MWNRWKGLLKIQSVSVITKTSLMVTSLCRIWLLIWDNFSGSWAFPEVIGEIKESICHPQQKHCAKFIWIPRNDSGRDTSFPALEAIVDAFKPVYDAVLEFQASHERLLHIVLPSIQFCKSQLSRIELGDSVIRENGTVQRPSIYSIRLRGVMKLELEQVEVHDL